MRLWIVLFTTTLFVGYNGAFFLNPVPPPPCSKCRYYVFAHCKLFDRRERGKNILLPVDLARQHEEFCGKNGTYFEPRKFTFF